MDQVILERHCDVTLRENEGVLALAYTNSHFQTGLKNVLDRAVLAHEETHAHARIPEFTKVDEIPFDFQRRIMSVVVRTPEGQDRIISQGRARGDLPALRQLRARRRATADGPRSHRRAGSEYERLSADGFRVLAIATKEAPPRTVVAGNDTPYGKDDECDLILQRLRRVPRPAQGDLRGRPSPPCRVTASPSRSSPATTIWWPARSARRWGCSSTYVLLGSDVEG